MVRVPGGDAVLHFVRAVRGGRPEHVENPMMPDPIRNIPRRRAPVLGRSQPESPRGSGTFQCPGSFRRCRGRGRPHSGNSEIGPRISGRVQEAFRTGEIRKKIDPAKKRFTPCTLFNSLLEAITEAAKNAAIGDVVLLSPACSSFDQFQNYQHRGEVFRAAVRGLAERAGAVASGQTGPGPASGDSRMN